MTWTLTVVPRSSVRSRENDPAHARATRYVDLWVPRNAKILTPAATKNSPTTTVARVKRRSRKRGDDANDEGGSQIIEEGSLARGGDRSSAGPGP